ncbi:hypothetical protein HPB48_005085 [Haemaphysalis longicornis]|uniref:Uncharacterized protein n=1 Tax=Haemaphysalis longicornis TaxID=44386 RepID=A0A9J6FFA5_HAELO|nr:hypothetical protein HPB48_005085 [Haemaphysalis longicornis]
MSAMCDGSRGQPRISDVPHSGARNRIPSTDGPSSHCGDEARGGGHRRHTGEAVLLRAKRRRKRCARKRAVKIFEALAKAGRLLYAERRTRLAGKRKGALLSKPRPTNHPGAHSEPSSALPWVPRARSCRLRVAAALFSRGMAAFPFPGAALLFRMIREDFNKRQRGSERALVLGLRHRQEREAKAGNIKHSGSPRKGQKPSLRKRMSLGFHRLA